MPKTKSLAKSFLVLFLSGLFLGNAYLPWRNDPVAEMNCAVGERHHEETYTTPEGAALQSGETQQKNHGRYCCHFEAVSGVFRPQLPAPLRVFIAPSGETVFPRSPQKILSSTDRIDPSPD